MPSRTSGCSPKPMENSESSRYLSVFKTKGGVSSFPLHSHPFWELLCYTQSCGQLRLTDEAIPFHEGTIICVPPYVSHGSASDTVFEDICVIDPDFRDPAIREKYRNDHYCTDPHTPELYRLATSKSGTPDVDEAVYEAVRAKFGGVELTPGQK